MNKRELVRRIAKLDRDFNSIPSWRTVLQTIALGIVLFGLALGLVILMGC